MQSNPEKISVVFEPSPHFYVQDWGMADAFDDYLTEKADLEFFAKTIERDGAFVARQFFPANALSAERMQKMITQFVDSSQI